MKAVHIAAVACFAVAVLAYALGGKPDIIGGFAVLGVFFETIGWKDFLTGQ